MPIPVLEKNELKCKSLLHLVVVQSDLDFVDLKGFLKKLTKSIYNTKENFLAQRSLHQAYRKLSEDLIKAFLSIS